MAPVRGGKRIVDVHLAQTCERGRKLRIVCLFAAVKAKILEQQRASGFEASYQLLNRAADALRGELHVNFGEFGQAVEELEVDYNGEAFELSFNARYLLDVTDQIAGEIAEFRFGGPNDPALVLDPIDADVQYVLMPLRV